MAAAEKPIAEVDAMPAPEAIKRIDDRDVQAALETVTTGGAHETRLSHPINAGTEEADAE